RHEVTHGRARIGTGAANQLRLGDPAVSRMHCEIRLQSDGVRIVDSASTNGTFVDGVRVLDAVLTAGATVRVGSTSFRVELGGAPSYLQIASCSEFKG